MIRKLFLGSAVAAVAVMALLLTVGSPTGKAQPAEAVVASISTTTTSINNDFWAQLFIVAEDDIVGVPNTSIYDLRVTATAGDFGGIDGCALLFLQWAQVGCDPVLFPVLQPACHYGDTVPVLEPCVILQTNGFPLFGGFFPTLLGPADRDITICNTGESINYDFDCSFDFDQNTTGVELWWRSPGGFPGGTVTFTAWQGSSVKTASITVRGAPATIDLVAQRDYTNEGSTCQGTPVYVIAAVEYDFNNWTTFNNNRAILCADVRDSNNTPLPGVEVIWSVSGGGCLTDTVTNTLTNGLTHNRLESCSTGNSGDIATVTATAGSATDSVKVEFGGNPASCTLTVSPDPLDIGDNATVTMVAVDEDGNKVPDGIIVNFVEVDSGDGADNVQIVDGQDDTVNSQASASIIGAISGLTTIAANIDQIAGSDPVCSEAIELSGDVHVHPDDCDDADFILYGNKPPAGGGFGTFAFCGGSWAALLDASGCPEATAVFFYNTPSGGFEVWIPGSSVAAVNAEIMARWPNQHNPIPEGTIFTAKCK